MGCGCERGDRVADGVADRVAGGATGGREPARFVQPVFQDPMGSLNPRRTVAEIVRRPLEVHAIGDRASRDARVLALLDQVGLPRRLFHAYPAQLSGGQRQRVAIARALVLEPQLLLCDEPTSALDVSVQAQILNLLAELREQRGLTLLVITHDLSVVRHMAQRVAVMYLGRIVEEGLTEQVFAHPAHPYTRALVAAALPIDTHGGIPPSELKPGFPNPLEIAPGCRFAPRCPLARDLCTSEPPRRATRDGYAMCHFAAAAA